MSDATICEIALPTADAVDPSWVAEQSEALMLEVAIEVLGAPDFHEGIASWVRNYREQTDHVSVNLVAVTGVDAAALPRGRFGLPSLSWDAAEERSEPGRVLGIAGVAAPLNDNPTLADFWFDVAPDHRGQGIGSALLAEAERIATQEWGRTTIMTWRSHHNPDGSDELAPPTGDLAIARDGAARFLLRHGYVLEQCERHSVCEVPCDEDTLQRLWTQCLPKAEGYSLRRVVDRCPDDLVERVCALLQHFTVEAPTAGLELEEEQWTVERFRRTEERRRANGKTNYSVVAIHDATGDVAALTDITIAPDHPEVAFQQVTIVDAGHRGHRLGWLVKVDNVRQLQELDPGRRRIHTWNAGENQWMLAINDAMGFRARLTEGAWQKKVR